MNRIIKNASWIIVCRVVQAILGLIIAMITARYLGPSDFGLLNYAMSVVAFTLPVMRLGLSIEQDDLEGLVRAIRDVCEGNSISMKGCLARAKCFDRYDKFKEYVDLYHKM